MRSSRSTNRDPRAPARRANPDGDAPAAMPWDRAGIIPWTPDEAAWWIEAGAAVVDHLDARDPATAMPVQIWADQIADVLRDVRDHVARSASWAGTEATRAAVIRHVNEHTRVLFGNIDTIGESARLIAADRVPSHEADAVAARLRDLLSPRGFLRGYIAGFSPRAIAGLRLTPPSIFLPARSRAVFGGVSVTLAIVPGMPVDLGAVREGFARYRERAGRIAPWLLTHAVPVELWNIERHDGRVDAEYLPPSRRVVRVYLPMVKHAMPSRVAHTLAHEQAHDLWQTRLTAAQRAAWSDEVLDRVALPVHRVLDLWDLYPEARTLAALVDAAETNLRDRDPDFYLQLRAAVRIPQVSYEERRPFAARANDPSMPLFVPARPVTAYGATSAEEAFCEAVGLIIGYGPRALRPAHRRLLADLTPGVRTNGRRGVAHRCLIARRSRA